MDVGSLLLMLGLSYALGVLWYDLLPGKLADRVWRAAAYPFLGIFIAQTLMAGWTPTLTFGGINLVAAVVGSIVAVIVDWIITSARHPAVVPQMELRRAA